LLALLVKNHDFCKNHYTDGGLSIN